MNDCKKISANGALGINVECSTLTKEFFIINNITNNTRHGLPLSFKEYLVMPIQYMEQVHGNSIQSIRALSKEKIKKTDALFSRSNKFSLAIMSADCLPIALANSEGSKIALLHAGWRGLSEGIISKSLKMFDSERDELKAWLAPCISEEKYAVGRDVFKAFVESDRDAEKSFKQLNSKKWKFDIRAEASRVLRKSNVSVSQSNYCTYKDEDLFYSYRRDKTDERVVTLLWRKNV